LDNPDDFVRIEIEAALTQQKLVIPVLVGEARMPRTEELPEAIRPLAKRNAVRLTHERFRTDAQGLIKALQQAIGKIEADRKSKQKVVIETKWQEERQRDLAAASARAAKQREGAEQRRKAKDEARIAAIAKAKQLGNRGIIWSLALAPTAAGLIMIAFGVPIATLAFGRMLIAAGVPVLGIGLVNVGLVANRTSLYWLLGLAIISIGTATIGFGILTFDTDSGKALVIAGFSIGSFGLIHITLAAKRAAVCWLLALATIGVGLAGFGYGLPLMELTVGQSLVITGAQILSTSPVHIGLAVNRTSVYWLLALASSIIGLISIGYGFTLTEFAIGQTLIVAGAPAFSLGLVYIAIAADRAGVYWLLGLGASAIGLYLILFGLPYSEFSYGLTLVAAGSTVLVSGLTIIHLALNNVSAVFRPRP
jgi:hypothetical protein